MVDVNALPVSSSEVSCVSAPRVLGMDPLRGVYCRFRACRAVIAEIDEGMVPLMLVEARLSALTPYSSSQRPR